MKVKAAKGVRVPVEHKPHQYITETETVDVENTLYYQRRVADGDLVLVERQGGEKRRESVKQKEPQYDAD